MNVRCKYLTPSYSLKDGNLYIGNTTNLKRRLEEHAGGESKSTAPRRPFELMLVEYYRCASDARRREHYLKTDPGKRMLKLLIRDSLKSYE